MYSFFSPWYIQWPDRGQIRLVSGSESFPPLSYKYHRAAKDVLEMYTAMLHTTNSMKPGNSNGINAGQYLDGFGVITFDLSRSHLAGESKVTETPRMSDLQVHMDFQQNLDEATSFIFILVRGGVDLLWRVK